MACREREMEISTYLDGELEEGRAAALGEHLRFCEVCQRTLAAMAETDRRISDLPFPKFGENPAERIAALTMADSAVERGQSTGFFGFLRWTVRDMANTLWPAAGRGQGHLEAFSDSPPFFLSRVYFGLVDAAR